MIHTVQQGDHISSIAEQYGFADYRTIWDHGDNASLKQDRPNPNVLFPGDAVTIPDRLDKKELRATGAVHPFVTTAKRLLLQIRIKDTDDKPDKNTDCVLNVRGIVYNLTTDGDGKIEQAIPRDAHDGLLTVHDIEIPLKIGNLDPVEEPTGQQARLNNLGYRPGPVGEDNPEQFRSAVEEFQCDQGMKVTGDCDSATQRRLQKVHGC
jgi:hypothetical protein